MAFPCSCAVSSFIDKDHGHILTGDMHIIKSNKQKKLICSGPTHRESKSVDFNSAKGKILEGIVKYIRS